MWVDVEAEARWLGSGLEWRRVVPAGEESGEVGARVMVEGEGVTVDRFLLTGRAGLERGLLVRVEGDQAALDGADGGEPTEDSGSSGEGGRDGKGGRDGEGGRDSEGGRDGTLEEQHGSGGAGGSAVGASGRGRSQQGDGDGASGGRADAQADERPKRVGGILPQVLAEQRSRGREMADIRKQVGGQNSRENEEGSGGRGDHNGVAVVHQQEQQQQQQQGAEEEEDSTAKLDLEQARGAKGGQWGGVRRGKGLGFLRRQLVARDQEFYEGGGAGDWEDDWDVVASSDVLHLLSPMQVR